MFAQFPKGVRFESMTLTTPSSIVMINRIKWKLHRYNESNSLTSSKAKTKCVQDSNTHSKL